MTYLCVTCYTTANGEEPDMGYEIEWCDGTCDTCGRKAIVFAD